MRCAKMAIYHNTTYDEEYLNTIELPELIFELERYLNNFFLLLREENLDVETYATSLIDAFQSRINNKSFLVTLPKLNEKCDQLSIFPKLREKYIFYCLNLLNIRSKEATFSEGSLEIPFYNILKSKLLSAYIIASNLTSIIPYEEAIHLFQKFMEIRVETDPTLDFRLDFVYCVFPHLFSQ